MKLPLKILVTGGAGFIGSNLVEALLSHPDGFEVKVMDNLSTGTMDNIRQFEGNPRFEFYGADIRRYEDCLEACRGVDLVSHQAALGSVPRSIADPLTSNAVNVSGTLNIFHAARESGIRRIVYAASSSTYGDHPGLPKREDIIGKPLSPYAVTKLVNELYAGIYADVYDMELIGLRYFNIFGPAQNPDGPYAAVIPLFIQAILEHKSPVINGDGTNSRDFTFVSNAVQANILSLLTDDPKAINRVYNIACGEETSLVQLFDTLCLLEGVDLEPQFGPERSGDVKHSRADISLAQRLLGYAPKINMSEGLEQTLHWYKSKHVFRR